MTDQTEFINENVDVVISNLKNMHSALQEQIAATNGEVQVKLYALISGLQNSISAIENVNNNQQTQIDALTNADLSEIIEELEKAKASMEQLKAGADYEKIIDGINDFKNLENSIDLVKLSIENLTGRIASIESKQADFESRITSNANGLSAANIKIGALEEGKLDKQYATKLATGFTGIADGLNYASIHATKMAAIATAEGVDLSGLNLSFLNVTPPTGGVSSEPAPATVDVDISGDGAAF